MSRSALWLAMCLFLSIIAALGFAGWHDVRVYCAASGTALAFHWI